MNNIKEIINWYQQFDNSYIVIKSEKHSFDLNILTVNLPHLLGLHYATYQRMRGKSLLNYIEKLDDEKIYNNIIKYNKDKLNLVKDRVKYFKYFMENLDKTLLVEQTHPTTKIKSDFLLVEDETGKILQLGIARDREDMDYFETFLVRDDNDYFKESTILEKIVSIEKWEQDKLVPFSFNTSNLHTKKTQKSQRDGKEYVLFLKNTVEIVEYATEILGFTPITSNKGKYISFSEHDSICVYVQDNEYFRYSTRKGGSIIDFVMEFQDCTFHEAIKLLTDYCKNKNIHYENNYAVNKTYKKIEGVKNATIQLPKKDENMKYVFSYLINQRCINPEVVKKYAIRNLLYQDQYHNCVFVGYDENQKVQYAAVRATYVKESQKLLKWEVGNSNKEIGFFVRNDEKSDTLVVCESAIDILSFESLNEKNQTYSYLAVGGLMKLKETLKNYLNQYHQYQFIVLSLDSDEPGKKATEDIQNMLQNQFPEKQIFVSNWQGYKDVNEYLCSTCSIQEEVER